MAKTISAGVFPVHYNKFEIDVSATETPSFAEIGGIETFEPAFENTVETWFETIAEGWQSSMKTGSAWNITLSGKRKVGDTGNDFLADMAMAIGEDAYATVKWTFPNGDTFTSEVTVQVDAMGAGDTTGVGSFEIVLTGNGKPTFVAAT